MTAVLMQKCSDGYHLKNEELHILCKCGPPFFNFAITHDYCSQLPLLLFVRAVSTWHTIADCRVA